MIGAPQTRSPDAGHAGDNLRKAEITGEVHDNVGVEYLQACRLKRHFGFAFETAAVVASLAWGIAR
jgi:hypothetical protein